jgi:hypothetical protein
VLLPLHCCRHYCQAAATTTLLPPPRCCHHHCCRGAAAMLPPPPRFCHRVANNSIIAIMLVASLRHNDCDHLHIQILLPLLTTTISAAAAAGTTIAVAILAGRLVVMLFSHNFYFSIRSVLDNYSK